MQAEKPSWVILGHVFFCHPRHTQNTGSLFRVSGPSSGEPVSVFSLREVWAPWAQMHLEATWGSSSSTGKSPEVGVLWVRLGDLGEGKWGGAVAERVRS